MSNPLNFSATPPRDRVLQGQTAVDKVVTEAWNEYAAELHRCCRIWMGSYEADSDEAFSRASVRIYLELPKKYSEVKNLGAWLRRLTFNACMDVYRERKRRREDMLEPDSTSGAPGEAVPQSLPVADPEQLYLRQELREFLMRAVEELPERLRRTMTRHLAGASYREIAVQLAINEPNVRKRMQEARKLLKQRLWAYSSGVASLPTPPRNYVTDATTLRVCAVTALPSGVEMRNILYLGSPPKRLSKQRLKILHRYICEHPNGWKKRLELGRQLREAGLFGEAIAEFERVVRKQPRSCEGWLELASVHLLQDRLDAAAAVYEQALDEVAGTARYFLRGLMERCRGRAERAIEAFKAVREATPENSASLVALADAWGSAGCPTEAVLALDGALMADAEDVAALTLGHDLLRLAGRSLEAERRAERALEVDATNDLARVLWIDARCRVTGGRFASGGAEIRQLRELRQIASSRADACRCLAFCLACHGDLNGAERLLTELVHKRTGLWQGWVEYARLLDWQGKPQLAIAAIDQVGQQRPRDRQFGLLRAWLLARAGFTREACRQVEALLERYCDAWDVASMGAWAYSTLGIESERALELSRVAVGQQTCLPAAWLEHGRVLACWDLPEQAAAALATGWELLPKDDGFDLAVLAAQDLAKVHRRIGDLETSRRWFRRARALPVAASKGVRKA